MALVTVLLKSPLSPDCVKTLAMLWFYNFTAAKMKRQKEQIEESVERYLHQLDSADRQELGLARATETARLKDKFAILKEEMERLGKLEARMLATPDQQISLTDPDARSMAKSGRGSGMVGCNVQAAVDTKHLSLPQSISGRMNGADRQGEVWI